MAYLGNDLTMNFHSIRWIAFAVVFMASCIADAADGNGDQPDTAKPSVESSAEILSAWFPQKIRGWTLHVSSRLRDSDDKQDERLLARAIELLDKQLAEIEQKVPAKAVSELKKVPLYFSPQYASTRPRAEYHPSSDWLRNNGRDPVMAKAIEFSNIRVFEAETRRMPNFALHELAHAYHDRVLGFDQPNIRETFQRAKASGKYESVFRQDSEGRRRKDKAYAMTNHKEYFAELTEAFFSTNDFFPFDRSELNAHDPAAVQMLQTAWGTNR